MEKIISTIRIRPASGKESEIALRKGEGSSVVSLKQGDQFSYEHVFDGDSSNAEVFEGMVKGLIDKSVEGYNICIFTYGQTSSGKTFTMKGSAEDPGIIPLSLKHLFDKIDSMDGEKSVKIDYVEIYNETINDLLKHGNCNLDLKTDADKSLKIRGLTQHEAKDHTAAMHYLYPSFMQQARREREEVRRNEDEPHVQQIALHIQDIARNMESSI